MDGFQLEDIMTMDDQQTRSARSKPAKRKWREIEAIKDRQRLQRELKEIDVYKDYDLDDFDL